MKTILQTEALRDRDEGDFENDSRGGNSTYDGKAAARITFILVVSDNR